MKKLIYILPVFALLLASCEDYYMENQLGYKPTIEDVRNFSYTLTDADYSALANNPTNKATALAQGEDETDSTYYDLLQEVGKQKYFTEVVAPDVYIPAFMAQKYPQLSNGTICEVFYSVLAEKPLWYANFAKLRTYTPETPLTSVDAIPTYLETQVRKALRTEEYKYIVQYDDDNAFVYCYNTTDSVFEPYQSEQNITVFAKNDYANLGFETMEIKDVAPNNYLPIYLKQRFPYAQVDDNQVIIYIYSNENDKINRQTTIGDYTFDGENWVERPALAEESMSFEMKEVWKANTSVFLSEPFIGHGQGDFTIQNVLLQDPLTYVWYYSATYGMCASAYKSNASYDSEAWLVSPRVKLKKAKQPALIFDQAFNKAANFTEECTVLVSTDYKGDVTVANWEALEWNKNEDGTLNVPPGTSWIFQTSGDMDLTKYAGQNIYIAFRYTTSKGISGTWELQNVLVHETAVEE